MDGEVIFLNEFDVKAPPKTTGSNVLVVTESTNNNTRSTRASSGMAQRDVNYIKAIFSNCDNYETNIDYFNYVYNNFPYFNHWHDDYYDFVSFYSSPYHKLGLNENADSGNRVSEFRVNMWSFQGSRDRMIPNSFNGYVDKSTLPDSLPGSYDKTFCVLLCRHHYNSIDTCCMGAMTVNNDISSNSSRSILNKDNISETLETKQMYYSYYNDGSGRQTYFNTPDGWWIYEPYRGQGASGSQHYLYRDSWLDYNGAFYTNHETYLPSNRSLPYSAIYGVWQPNIDYPPELTYLLVNCEVEQLDVENK